MCLLLCGTYLKQALFIIKSSPPILSLFVCLPMHRNPPHTHTHSSPFPSALMADIIHSTLHSNALLFTMTVWFKTIKTNSSLAHNGLA